MIFSCQYPPDTDTTGLRENVKSGSSAWEEKTLKWRNNVITVYKTSVQIIAVKLQMLSTGLVLIESTTFRFCLQKLLVPLPFRLWRIKIEVMINFFLV